MQHIITAERTGTRLGLTCTAMLLMLASARIAAAQAPIGAGPLREGTLSFDGRATMGAFTGTTTTVSGELIGGPDLETVRGWVESPVATLRTGKHKRDADLNKSMESDRYETIRFELLGVTTNAWQADTASVTLHGRFIIHGVTRETDLPARVIVGTEQLQLRAEAPLSLKDYDIHGLSKMLGMLKMQDQIVVHVDLTFGGDPQKQSSLWPATGGVNDN